MIHVINPSGDWVRFEEDPPTTVYGSFKHFFKKRANGIHFSDSLVLAMSKSEFLHCSAGMEIVLACIFSRTPMAIYVNTPEDAQFFNSLYPNHVVYARNTSTAI